MEEKEEGKRKLHCIGCLNVKMKSHECRLKVESVRRDEDADEEKERQRRRR